MFTNFKTVNFNAAKFQKLFVAKAALNFWIKNSVMSTIIKIR